MICSESFLFGDYSDLKNTYQLVRWQNQKTSPGRWSLLGWQVPLIRIWQRANPLSFIAFLFWGVWIGHVVPKPRMPSWKKWRFSLAWNPLRNPTYTYTLYTYTYIYTQISVWLIKCPKDFGSQRLNGHGKFHRWWIGDKDSSLHCWSLWAVI